MQFARLSVALALLLACLCTAHGARVGTRRAEEQKFDIGAFLKSAGEALKPTPAFKPTTPDANNAKADRPRFKSTASSDDRHKKQETETQKSPSLLELKTSADLEGLSAVPSFEELPSMLPRDGLNAADPAKLPSVSELLPSNSMSSDAPLAGKMHFTSSRSTLPPLMGDAAMLGAFPALMLPQDNPRLKRLDHGNLGGLGAASLGMPPTFMGMPMPPASPPSMLPLPSDPANHPFISHVPMVMPGGFGGMPSLLPRLHLGVHNGPMHGLQYAELQATKASIAAQRNAALDALAVRKREIDFVQSFVDGGEAWIAQKESMWNKWVDEERRKGSESIEVEKKKVGVYRERLDKLLKAQQSDSQKVNQYNTEMRKISVEFQLKQKKLTADEAAAQQKRLADELAKSQKEKAAIDAELATINSQLTKLGGENSGPAAGAGAGAGAPPGGPPGAPPGP